MNREQNRDEFFMKQAIDEAQKALSSGEVPIGAVVVCGDRIVGRGHNLVETLGDATAHAEMQAITSAAGSIGSKYLKDCTLYVTVEPCVMCAGACFWSQILNIVYGSDDPKRGASTLGQVVYHPKAVVKQGVLENECKELMTIFFAELRT